MECIKHTESIQRALRHALKKEKSRVDQYFLGLLECIHKTAMSYVAARYYVFIAAAVILYYIIPKKGRWLVLLASSVYFCFEVSSDYEQLIVFGASILISYLASLFIGAKSNRLDGKNLSHERTRDAAKQEHINEVVKHGHTGDAAKQEHINEVVKHGHTRDAAKQEHINEVVKHGHTGDAAKQEHINEVVKHGHTRDAAKHAHTEDFAKNANEDLLANSPISSDIDKTSGSRISSIASGVKDDMPKYHNEKIVNGPPSREHAIVSDKNKRRFSRKNPDIRQYDVIYNNDYEDYDVKKHDTADDTMPGSEPAPESDAAPDDLKMDAAGDTMPGSEPAPESDAAPDDLKMDAAGDTMPGSEPAPESDAAPDDLKMDAAGDTMPGSEPAPESDAAPDDLKMDAAGDTMPGSEPAPESDAAPDDLKMDAAGDTMPGSEPAPESDAAPDDLKMDAAENAASDSDDDDSSKAAKSARNIAKGFALALGIIFSAAPLIVTKFGDLIESTSSGGDEISWIIPIGLSFYSMQIISYLVDVYRGDCPAQKNPLKYILYVSFFPIIIQGPISRYGQLSETLYKGNAYDSEKLMRGIQLILWGLFLKYMIAEKAAIVVNHIFDNSDIYAGCYILLAGIFYSIQLYTDFLSCVTISRGAAGLFGIELANNFNHPYFSRSIKEFWRRWHITLSEWLRDYIYIPLGGNRKGKVRKYFNLIATFAVSGLWHGSRWKYVVWGLMHAAYQIIGDLIHKPKDAICEKISLSKNTKARKVIDMIITSFLVMIAWIIFRADTLEEGLMMIGAMFSNFNPWIFFNDSIFSLGLSQKDFGILAISIAVLVAVSAVQEIGIKIRDWFNRQNLIIRWMIYLCAIWSIWIFGTYGVGFDAADFIYGGF